MADMNEKHAENLLDVGTEYRVVSYDNNRLELVRISGPRQTLPVGSRVTVRKS